PCELERLQITDCQRVLVIPSHRLPHLSAAITLRIKMSGTTLPTGIQVDERRANTTAVVQAELELAQAMTGTFQQDTLDIVAGTQVSQPKAHGAAAERIAMHYPLGIELVALAFSITGEAETNRLGAGSVVTLVVVITKRPPTPGYSIGQALLGRMAPAITDRINCTAQLQLITQSQRTVPCQGKVPLLLPGTGLTIIVARHSGPPRITSLTIQAHQACAHFIPRNQIQLHRARGQAGCLINQQFKFPQVEPLTSPSGKSHGQLAFACQSRIFHSLQHTFDDQNLKNAITQVLLRQISSAGHVAPIQIEPGNTLEYLIELIHPQTLAGK